MAVSVFKTFSAGEVLTASDLNSSFTQITSNGEDLGWPATTSKDLNGNSLILDVDADTSITSDTDDQIDFELGGLDVVRFKTVVSAANGLDVTASSAGLPVIIAAQGTDTNINILLDPKGTGSVDLDAAELILDTDGDTSVTSDTDDQIDFKIGGTDLIRFKTVASAVNGLDITASATGNAITLASFGTDAAIPIVLAPKGGASVRLGGVPLEIDADNDSKIQANGDDAIQVILGGAAAVEFKTVASAVNTLDVTAAATGTAVKLEAVGTDTDINLEILAKGSGAVDINGKELILDADGDTSITADTDDQIDFKIGGTDVLSITSAGLPRRRNLIIGGDFHRNPFARGTSFAGLTNTSQFVADRFEFISNDNTAVVTGSKSADAPTVAQANVFSSSCLLIDVTTSEATISAGERAGVYTYIEGYDWSLVTQRAFVLSFWHKHTKTGTYCVAFQNSGADRSYVVEYTQSVTDTWEKATVTVTASPTAGTWDYTNGTGLRVVWVMAAGATFHTTADAWQTGNLLATSNQVNGLDNVANNFRLALIQLEEGSTATAFELRSFEEEQALAERYFEKSYDAGTDPGTSTELGALHANANGTGVASVHIPFRFHTPKRAAPTVVVYSTTGATGNMRDLTAGADRAAAPPALGEGAITIQNNGAGLTDNNEHAAHFTAEAELS